MTASKRVRTSRAYRNRAPGWGPGEAPHRPRKQGWGGQGRGRPGDTLGAPDLAGQGYNAGRPALALTFSELA